jgi:hypothetical protein
MLSRVRLPEIAGSRHRLDISPAKNLAFCQESANHTSRCRLDFAVISAQLRAINVYIVGRPRVSKNYLTGRCS